MATFVLVHGAWHGGWCWKRVRKDLQARGHDVFTPTLTGLADRSHLLSRQVNLETHILDIMNLLRWEELSDVVLCGHSYGGSVISGVADRMPDRVRALVYLDAFVLADGENVLQHVPERLVGQFLEAAKSVGEGWKVPPIPAEAFNSNSQDRDWVNRQCTMHPLESFQERINLSGGIKQIRNVTFILAAGFVEGSPFPPFHDRAKAMGWSTIAMPCGHEVMLDRPEQLTRVLLDVCEAQPSAVS